jgi:hypothetical protein
LQAGLIDRIQDAVDYEHVPMVIDCLNPFVCLAEGKIELKVGAQD